jgi:hypothetical protein
MVLFVRNAMCRLVFLNKLVTSCMRGAVVCRCYHRSVCFECWSVGVVLCVGEFVFEVMYQLQREAIVFGYGAYGIPCMLFSLSCNRHG